MVTTYTPEEKVSFNDMKDDEIKQYIQDKAHYYRFQIPMIYKSVKKKAQEGIPVGEVPTFLLGKPLHLFIAPEDVGIEVSSNLSHHRDITSYEIEKLNDFLNKAISEINKQLEEINKKHIDAPIIFKDLSLRGDKMQDGNNGLYFYGINYKLIPLKPEDAVNRFIRASIKNLIQLAFRKYLKDNQIKRISSTVLPTSLLNKFLEDKIEYKEFMSELYLVRLKKHTKLGKKETQKVFSKKG